MKLGKCGRRVLQSGVRAWFNPSTGWEECGYYVCMNVLYVLVMSAWWWSLLQCVFMSKLIKLLLGCVFHECMSVVYVFVMQVSVYVFLCIIMGMVVTDEVRICSWYCHA